MTIQGVIADLQYLIDADDMPFYYKGGIKKMIETISMELPTPEVSEDCISRAWVHNKLTEYVKDYALNELDSWQNTIVEWIATDIEDAPSVVPSRAEGEWVRNFDGNEWYWYCTNCKTQWYEDDLWMGGNEFPNYCPDCGAKMKGADDEKLKTLSVLR